MLMWLDENGNLFYLEQPHENYTDDHMQEQPQEYYTDDHMQEQPQEYYTDDHMQEQPQEYYTYDQSNDESFHSSKVVSLLSGSEDLSSQQDVLLPSKSTIFVTPAPVEPTAEGLVLANDGGMLHKIVDNEKEMIEEDKIVNAPESENNDDTDVMGTDTELGKKYVFFSIFRYNNDPKMYFCFFSF